MNNSVDRHPLLTDLFAAIDAMDTARFVAKLTPNAEFRFGMAPAVRDRAPIGEAVDAFFATIAGLRHNVSNVITDGARVACEGDVTYTRHDGTEVTLPFADIFDFDGDLIADYRIYIDIGPLYATTP